MDINSGLPEVSSVGFVVVVSWMLMSVLSLVGMKILPKAPESSSLRLYLQFEELEEAHLPL